MSNLFTLLSRSPFAISEVAQAVRAGADIHERGLHISRRTLLEMAAAKSDPDYVPVIRELAALGADVNSAHPSNGTTPLHNAARYACVGTVRALCELGADPNARDNAGRTPAFYVLERTAPNNSVEVMRALLLELFDAGADSLIKDDSGKTLLKATRTQELVTVIRSARIGDRIAGAIDAAAPPAAVEEGVPVAPSARKSIAPL